ncbi:MAG: hypothetical protein ACI870_000326 [Crocinitomicaceae bacterium]|jgi:hypothetical protein
MDNKDQQYKDLQEQLNVQQEALVKIYTSVEKTRKIIFWSGIMNLVVFVLPLIAVAVLLPNIMSSFTSSLNSFSGTSSSAPVEAISQPSLSESLQNLKDLGL